MKTKRKVVVLGCGMMGRAIAADLSTDYQVTVVDSDSNPLNNLKSNTRIKKIKADLTSERTIKNIVRKFDLAVGALPSRLGFNTLKYVIETGKNIVDISFFSEDPFKLDKSARVKNVTCIVDCGVSPGLSNLILGYMNSRMKVLSYECFVGGLPYDRSGVYEYKAPFAPSDVIEEYVRPARLVVNGKIVVQPALSGIETFKAKEIGLLEAFNSDGLRTLLKTMKIPNMKEKTIRYPGHAMKMKLLRDTGFFSDNEIKLGKNSIKPIELTSRLLFPLWKLNENEDEFTIMRIKISGMKDGEKREYVFSLCDRFDRATKTSSMARTTGYTCTAAARLVLEEEFTAPGISPPEYIGKNESCYKSIIAYLAERNIKLKAASRKIK